MCSCMSSTRTSWSGPRAFGSAMVSRASGDVARVAQHVGHRDLMEDECERPDHTARRADRAGEERFVGGLDRPDGGSPGRLELGEQLGHAEVRALGYLPVVVRVVAALHGAGRRRCLLGRRRPRDVNQARGGPPDRRGGGKDLPPVPAVLVASLLESRGRERAHQGHHFVAARREGAEELGLGGLYGHRRRMGPGREGCQGLPLDRRLESGECPPVPRPVGVPVSLVRLKTRDGVWLDGVVTEPKRRPRTALVLVHGLGSVFSAAPTLSRELSTRLNAAAIGYFKFNTRGHHIVPRGRARPAGAAYERFVDCVEDIRTVLAFARQCGYRRVVLAGHSTGANKVLFYASRPRDRRVVGIILLGPVSDVGAEAKRLGRRELRRRVAAAERIARRDPQGLVPRAWGYWSARRYIS